MDIMGYVKDFLINSIYYLMDYTPLILYILGILGICLCIYLLATKFNKKNKLASIFTLFIICLSIIILTTGTILSLKQKKEESKKSKGSTVQTESSITENSTSKNTINTTDKTEVKPVADANTKNNTSTLPTNTELTLEYNSDDFKCPISIKNNTTKVFTGTISVDLLDNSKSSVSKYTIPVNNLIQSSGITTNKQVTSMTSDLNYNYSGKFNNVSDSSVGYLITSMNLGNGYLSFDVSASDVSLASLKHICETFKNTYNKSLCSGFTIYFVDYKNNSNIYAEYFCNNILSDSSNLLIYADNTTYSI